MAVTGGLARARRHLQLTLLLAVALLALGALHASAAEAAGTVTVSISGQGSASGPGIDCNQSGGPDCSEEYADQEICEFDPETRQNICYGQHPDVTLTAGADQNGYVFNGWTGCDSFSLSLRTCEMTVAESRSVAALFRDAQAPSVSGISPSGVQRGTITLGANAGDNSGSVTRVEFRVRGFLVATDFTAPYSSSFNTSSVADGAATIRATAFDAAGNSGYSESSITIDNTPPTLSIASGPNGHTFGPGTTQTWNFSAADATSGLASVQCSVVPNGSPPSYGSCSGGNSSHSVSGRPEGSYTFSVRARDNGGLETVQNRSFSIDATPPVTTITGGPADGSSSSNTSATFTFGSSESGSTFECRVYPAALTPPAFGPCSGDGSHTASGFSPGTYSFEVRAIDQFGNVDGSPEKRTFTVTSPSDGGGGGGLTGGGGSLGQSVSDALIAGALASDLGSAARSLSKQRMRRLARRGSLTLRLRALQAGRFSISFKGAATKARASKSIVIAKATRSVTAAGKVKITLKLTKAGKKLLRRTGKRVKGKLTVSFTMQGGGKLSRSRLVTLKRR